MGPNGELIPVEDAAYVERKGRLYGPDGNEVDPQTLQPIEQQQGAPARDERPSEERRYVLVNGELVPVENAGDDVPADAPIYTDRGGPYLIGPDGSEVDRETLQPVEHPQAPTRHDDSRLSEQRDQRHDNVQPADQTQTPTRYDDGRPSDERVYVLVDGQLTPVEETEVYVERDGQLYDSKVRPVGPGGQPIRQQTAQARDEKEEKKDVGGAVYVQGLDPARTAVVLSPGFRTIVRIGEAPSPPFPIDPARFRMLDNIQFMSFVKGSAAPRAAGKGVKAEPAPEIREDIVMESIIRKVSVPRVPRGGNIKSLEELESQYSQGSGLSSPGSGDESAGASVPVFYRAVVKVNLR